MNNSSVFSMPSMTYAYKARTLLEANGFRAKVVKLPHTTANGCTYGVSVRGRPDDAYALLAANGIRPSARFDD